MLRLIGVKPITLRFLRQTRLLEGFGSKGTAKIDTNPRVSHSESQGRKIPLKRKAPKAESNDLDNLLASTGISELIAKDFGAASKQPEDLIDERDASGKTSPEFDSISPSDGSKIKLQADQSSEGFSDSPLRLLNLLTAVDHKHCRGCGAVFQFERSHREGYVDLTRLDKGLQKREATNTPEVSQVLKSLISERIGSGGVVNKLRALKTTSSTAGVQLEDSLGAEPPAKELAKEALLDGHAEMYSVEDYLNDTIGLENLEDLENLFEDKIVLKDICDRCVHLKNNDIDKVRAVEINLESSF